MSHVTGASAHRLIGAQVWLGAHVTDGVLPLQASVVEHSDQSRKTVTRSMALRSFAWRRLKSSSLLAGLN